MEGAKKSRQRLCNDLPECEAAAPRVRAKRTDQAHRQFEGDGHRRFDGGHRSAQCGGLFEVAIGLASRQRKLVLELPCRVRNLGLPIEEAIGSVHQAGFVGLRRSRHVTQT